MCVSDAAAWAADRAYGDTRLAIASHSTLQNLNDHLGAVQNGELRSRQFYVAKTHPASGKSRRRVLSAYQDSPCGTILNASPSERFVFHKTLLRPKSLKKQAF